MRILLRVLIDTWWNVNAFYSVHNDIKNHVLIDTWWNVNNGKTIFSDFL